MDKVADLCLLCEGGDKSKPLETKVADLCLLYEGGDKSKPLSPMVINEKGEKVGRNLGYNSHIDISEWASMVYLLQGEKKKSDKYNNSNCRKFNCTGCDSTLHTTRMLFQFILLPDFFMHVLIFCLS